MQTDSKIGYHLNELKIAANPGSKFHYIPSLSEKDKTILDIGCGIGQTLLVLKPNGDQKFIGLDIDLKCLQYGHANFGGIEFINGTAEKLPFENETFDFIFSRVSLPYTNIPDALSEIYRILKRDGRVWISLHSFSRTIKYMMLSLRHGQIKSFIFQIYVLINGVYLQLCGKCMPFPLIHRNESFQTCSGMRRLMEGAGFVNTQVVKQGVFLVMADKR